MPSPLPDPCPTPTRPLADDPRRALLEIGGAETARARRYGRALGIVMIEITGDETLAHTVLDTLVRTGMDTILQLEATRMIVVLPETALGGTMHGAARLQQGLATCGVKARVGFATLANEDAGFLDLLKRAQRVLER